MSRRLVSLGSFRALGRWAAGDTYGEDFRVRSFHCVDSDWAADEVLAKLPPCRFMAAERDILLDQGLRLHERLKRLGVDSTHVTVPRAVHLFVTVPGQPEAFAQAVDLVVKDLQP